MTALHWAAKKSEEEVAKLLIDKGADVYAEDKDGKKPLDIARELWPNSRVTQLLYENDYSLQEVATYAGEVAVGTAEIAGTVALVTAAGVAGLAIDAAVAVGELAVGAVQAVANAPAPVYDEERRGRLRDAAGAAPPGSYAYYRRTEHVRRDYGYDDDSGCSIQSYQKQQRAYLHLSQFVSHNLQSASIELVKQSLYSPSFEELGIKMDGKCAAITRGFSQGLFFLINVNYSRITPQQNFMNV